MKNKPYTKEKETKELLMAVGKLQLDGNGYGTLWYYG